MERPRMNRGKVRWVRMDEAFEEECVEGTIGERLAMVWPLTLDVLAFNRSFDAESRLQRHLVRPLGP